MPPSRRTVLTALLAAMLSLTVVVLFGVLATVVFAVTVAYVLYPLRQELRRRGLSTRLAAATATTTAFLALLVIAGPIAYVLYSRRAEFVDFLRAIPAAITVDVGGLTYVVETDPLLEVAIAAVRSLATSLATAAPVFALKALLFVLVVYGILYAPTSPRTAVLRLCPGEYHDIVFALHRRTASTLRAIYVLQAATAFGTFLVAFVLLVALGYRSPFALAVVAGLLQFVPVLGPSIVVVALAAVDVVAGNVVRALLVTGLGLFFVGFVPDAVIRSRLASETTDMPVSVYFVGFVGGLLSLGAIGFVVGPLVVALLAEVVSLLSDGTASEQTQLSGVTDGRGSSDGAVGDGGTTGDAHVAGDDVDDAPDGVAGTEPTDG
ncbi:AI-2E family transporter [Halorarum halobium]|uniref:AI-2E family transporter n=1 Tax=Halorarum halobium TaxID=3075121 RepID=UPI0028AE99E0|nr:AI-2E family transporter [Halobaculum sp. XH14]